MTRKRTADVLIMSFLIVCHAAEVRATMGGCTVQDARAAFDDLSIDSSMGSAGSTVHSLRHMGGSASRFNVLDDLIHFTGLTIDELVPRVSRKGRFHFAAEHMYWNPHSTREQLWYYRTSLGYLFGMSLHPYEPVVSFIAHSQQKGAYDFGDVLDFSGGVGANVLLLATHRVRTTYSAVSVLDTAFVRYRVARRGLTRNVSFIEPYSARTNWRLDPPAALMEHHERFGVILAIGVLEHIDHFERTVRAMVRSLALLVGICAHFTTMPHATCRQLPYYNINAHFTRTLALANQCMPIADSLRIGPCFASWGVDCRIVAFHFQHHGI